MHHIVKIEIGGVKLWECKWCNHQPTSHWNAAKALARVSKLYITMNHISVCKAIILPGYLSWYYKLTVWRSQQKRKLEIAEQETEEEIMLIREMVTKAMSVKRSSAGDRNVPASDTASYSSHGRQATL